MERSKESKLSVSYKHFLIGIKLLDELFFLLQENKRVSAERMVEHFSKLDFEFAKDDKGGFPEYLLQDFFKELEGFRDSYSYPTKAIAEPVMKASCKALKEAIKGQFLIAHHYLGVLYANNILEITHFPYFDDAGPYQVVDNHTYNYEAKCQFLRALLSFWMPQEYINFYNDNFSKIKLKFFKLDTLENTITKSLYALCDLCTPYSDLEKIDDAIYKEKIKRPRYDYKSAEFPHLAEFSKIFAHVIFSIQQDAAFRHVKLNQWYIFLSQFMAIYNVFRYLHARKDIQDDDQKSRRFLFGRDLQRMVEFGGESLEAYFTRTGEGHKLYIPRFLGIPFGITQAFQDLRMQIGNPHTRGIKETAEFFIECLKSLPPQESFALSLCPVISVSVPKSDVNHANFEIEETDEEENPDRESTNSL